MVGRRKISVPPCWAWCQITVGTSPANLYSSTAVRTCSVCPNCMLLEHKPIIVIGADEIGAGIAHRLEREGARLALLAVPPDYNTIEAAVEAAVKQLGGVYALINNLLPIPALAPLESQTGAMFGDVFARVQATVRAMQPVMPFMRDAGEGRIVNVGHRYGEGVNEGITAY